MAYSPDLSIYSDQEHKTNLISYLREAYSNDSIKMYLEDIDEPQIDWITPMELYNKLNQETSRHFSRLSDRNYLSIFDCRNKEEYFNQHIITAKHIDMNTAGTFIVPFGAELECKQNVVVYDINCRYSDQLDAPALKCAYQLFVNGSRHSVKILQGGYTAFATHYPLYNTIQILYTPQELDAIPVFPNEIIPQKLYLGNLSDAHNDEVHKILRIQSHINCFVDENNYFPYDNIMIYKINRTDIYGDSVDIINLLQEVCKFIDQSIANQQRVLVFSKLGINSSVFICLAYLIYKDKLPIKVAYKKVKLHRENVSPTIILLDKLLKWENIHCSPIKKKETVG